MPMERKEKEEWSDLAFDEIRWLFTFESQTLWERPFINSASSPVSISISNLRVQSATVYTCRARFNILPRNVTWF